MSCAHASNHVINLQSKSFITGCLLLFRAGIANNKNQFSTKLLGAACLLTCPSLSLYSKKIELCARK